MFGGNCRVRPAIQQDGTDGTIREFCAMIFISAYGPSSWVIEIPDNMLPTSFCFDRGNFRHSHSVFSCYFRLLSWVVKNRNDLFISKLCLPVLSSLPRLVAPFRSHISVVVQARSKEQMIWVDTPRVVAFVTNKKTVGYLTYIKNVRKAMGAHCLSIRAKQPIILSSESAGPYPAAWRNAKLFLKALFCRSSFMEAAHKHLLTKFPLLTCVNKKLQDKKTGDQLAPAAHDSRSFFADGYAPPDIWA